MYGTGCASIIMHQKASLIQDDHGYWYTLRNLRTKWMLLPGRTSLKNGRTEPDLSH